MSEQHARAPGRRGFLVVSSGMLARLDPDEFAHERAHLNHRHDLYIRAGSLASSAVPFLRPLANRVQYSLERWADEIAARELGDRELVARAIARAALARHDYAPMLSFAQSGILERIEALTDPATHSSRPVTWLGGTVEAATTAVLSGVEFHQLARVAFHTCS